MLHSLTSKTEFEVDHTLDRNILIFSFMLIERNLSWSNCNLVHGTEGKDNKLFCPKLISIYSFEDRRTSLAWPRYLS